MKYAIYDKAADAYLTKMEFDTDLPDNHTQYARGYNEYITNARLLDTKEEASDVIARIYSFKFMDKGRFVIHSFDDTLIDQYVISEAGNPTKVVDNITVDLDGTINVKYGTMMSHWSTISLNDAIDRMNALQKAVSAIYTSWNNTFDIYKVITIMDEKEHTHYQFIKVTDEGLDFAKDEEESSLSKRITSNWKYLYEESYKDRVTLNKRIEDLEKANYELGEQVAERGAVANCLLDENNSLKAKVESIKKEARDWKKLYEGETQKYIDTNLSIWKKKWADKVKESNELRVARDCSAEIIHAIRNAIYHNDSDAFCCIENRMKFDHDFNSDPFMAVVRENIKDICTAEKRNIANHELKNSEIARLAEERDKALERAEKFKGIANSVYGMTVPGRCCGKQAFTDVATGKKIIINKVRYDSLVESVDTINTTYDILKRADFTTNKPAWLPGLLSSIKDLTK